MHRNPHSRKGENGIVTVIGGSKKMHGAPLFSALAAEASGVDLLHVCVPECHAETAKAASNNFIVTPFRGNELSKEDVSALEDLLAASTAAVVGPGLAEYETTQQALKELIHDAAIPLVIDAAALQPWTFDAVSGRANVVLTPHIGELERMQGQVLAKKAQTVRKDLVCTIAKERRLTMILKGPVDTVAGEDQCREIGGGNAGLTVGGTGDALAGVIAGLIAQGITPFDACVMATTIMKSAATVLFQEKGYAFTTMDVIGQMPHLLHTYDV